MTLLVGPTPAVSATLPRTWGPLLGVAAVFRARDGSLTAFIRDVLAIPERPWLLALAALLPVALGEVDVVLAVATGTPVSRPILPLSRFVDGFLLVALLAGGLEEFGWRAYLQPALRAGAPAVLVALSIGILWVTRHLPLFVLFDLRAYDLGLLPLFTGVLMVASVVLAWLYNETDGNDLAPMAFHAAANLPAVGRPGDALPGLLDPIGRYGYPISLLAIAFVVVLVRGGDIAGSRLPARL